jgi:hypothetical protein
MRPNNQQRRPRGRNGGGGGGNHGGGGGGGGHKGGKPQRNQTYDSSGPEVRVRGNAHQIFEKYQVLAREATTAGDRIAAESYYQHAEHYLRLINLSGGFQQQRGPGWNEGENFEEGGENRGGENRGGENRNEQQRPPENREGRHNGPNGYNGRDERPYQGREQNNNGVDPEGDQPDLPVTAFPQSENS